MRMLPILLSYKLDIPRSFVYVKLAKFRFVFGGNGRTDGVLEKKYLIWNSLYNKNDSLQSLLLFRLKRSELAK